jgi:DNA-binding winged helix-turn-helix (wHTH) protein
MAKHFYKFGPYCLDLEERVLRRGDEPLALPPKDLETLIVLVQRAGHIVEKDELLEKVWPGVFIEEGNLSRRIFNLRQVLGGRLRRPEIYRDHSSSRLSVCCRDRGGRGTCAHLSIAIDARAGS